MSVKASPVLCPQVEKCSAAAHPHTEDYHPTAYRAGVVARCAISPGTKSVHTRLVHSRSDLWWLLCDGDLDCSGPLAPRRGLTAGISRGHSGADGPPRRLPDRVSVCAGGSACSRHAQHHTRVQSGARGDKRLATSAGSPAGGPSAMARRPWPDRVDRDRPPPRAVYPAPLDRAQRGRRARRGTARWFSVAPARRAASQWSGRERQPRQAARSGPVS